MLSYLKRVFGLDYRSLAALRFFVGLTLLLDLIQRANSLTAHYTDAGVLPRGELMRLWNESAFWSLYNINGSATFVAVMFIIAGVFSVMMILGYRSKFATIASFVMLISLHTRAPLVLQGGDVALRVILFFMMFLPLNKRFSLDIILGNTNYPKEKEYYSIFSVAYVVQFLLIWVLTGFLKTGAPWVLNFTAASMALSLDAFTTNFGNWLRTFPELLRYITAFTILVERYVFTLFILPIKLGWGRILGIFLCTVLIIGFNLSFRLGLFGMIMFSISLGLLPGIFWDKILVPLHSYLSKKSQSGISIFYDGDCGFCKRISNATLAILFLHPSTVTAMSNTDTAANNLMHTAHSWVVRDSNGRSYTGFRAFVALMQSAFLYRIIAPIFLLRPVMYVGEITYGIISHNRPMTCSVDMTPAKKTDFENRLFKTTKFAVGTILIFVVFWNIISIPKYSGQYKSRFIEKTLMLFRLDQKWNMFAPFPTTEDGFYVIPGVLRDGSSVNVYTGQDFVSYEKPNLPAWSYKDQRWQKYMMNIWLKDFSNYRLGYGQYLCRKWNTKNSFDKNLMTFNIVYMLENTNMDTLEEYPLEKVSIWEHNCFN